MTKNEVLKQAHSDFEFFITFFLTHHITDEGTGKITPFNQMALPLFVEYRLKPIK